MSHPYQVGPRVANTHPMELQPSLQTDDRMEELHAAISTALAVNKHLNTEVETYVVSLEQSEREREAWQQHSRSLARRLTRARKRASASRAVTGSPQQPDNLAHDTISTSSPHVIPGTQCDSATHSSASDGAGGARTLDTGADTARRRSLSNGQQFQSSPVSAQQQSLASSHRRWLAEQVGDGDVSEDDDAEELHQLLQLNSLDSNLDANSISQPSAAPASERQNGSSATGASCSAAAGSNGNRVQPTAAQAALLAALVTKGRVAGWVLSAAEVHRTTVLGSGSFGTTYRGTWRGADVAVKCVRISSPSELTTFLREVECLAHVRHPHVLPFLGAVVAPPDECWLVTEFMTGGTLAAWLHPSAAALTAGAPAHSHLQQQTQQLHQSAAGSRSGAANGAGGGGVGGAGGGLRPFLQRLHMALDVASGLQALEACSPPILHRDVKPSNVFIDAGGRARVGDFGLSRRLLAECRATLTGETGTYLYMAPEMMRHEVYDNRADVWSWGVLFVECMTCQMPYVHTYLTPVQVAVGVADEALRPEPPASVDTDLQVLANMACSYDPDTRPPFSMLVEELSAALTKLGGAPEPQGMLDKLRQQLTSSWGGVLSRIYPRNSNSINASSASSSNGKQVGGSSATQASGLGSSAGMDISGPISSAASHVSSSTTQAALDAVVLNSAAAAASRISSPPGSHTATAHSLTALTAPPVAAGHSMGEPHGVTQHSQTQQTHAHPLQAVASSAIGTIGQGLLVARPSPSAGGGAVLAGWQLPNQQRQAVAVD